MKTPTSQTQEDLETLFSKHQLLPVLREQFAEILDEIEEEDRNFYADMLSQIYLHRQADVPTMVGVLSPKYGTPQEVADRLLMAAEFDFIDYDQDKKRFLVKYDVSDDVKAMLERYQYPLPMVVKPNEVKKNSDTGYHTIRGSVVLNGSEYFKDKDMCLDHINRANGVPLALDFSVVKSTEGRFDKPKRKNGEDFSDYRKRLRQAVVFYETSVEVMEGLDALTDEIYMTHKYDRRGRCYSSGYHISPQGDDYRKAVLQFAKKEVIT